MEGSKILYHPILAPLKYWKDLEEFNIAVMMIKLSLFIS